MKANSLSHPLLQTRKPKGSCQGCKGAVLGFKCDFGAPVVPTSHSLGFHGLSQRMLSHSRLQGPHKKEKEAVKDLIKQWGFLSLPCKPRVPQLGHAHLTS